MKKPQTILGRFCGLNDETELGVAVLKAIKLAQSEAKEEYEAIGFKRGVEWALERFEKKAVACLQYVGNGEFKIKLLEDSILKVKDELLKQNVELKEQ